MVGTIDRAGAIFWALALYLAIRLSSYDKNSSLHTPLYENRKFERELSQWRLLEHLLLTPEIHTDLRESMHVTERSRSC